MTKALAALAAVGLALAVAPAAPAQAVSYDPVTGRPYVQNYNPYPYGPNGNYSPGWPYVIGSPYGRPPIVYGPGYTTNTPWQYNSYRYNRMWNGGSPTFYRTWRWQP